MSRPFDEPWQAEAFALVVALNEAGRLPWDAWADALSRALGPAALAAGDALPTEHDPQANAAYWRAWLDALEEVGRSRGWVAPLELGARRVAVRAYARVAAVPASFGSTGGPPHGSDLSAIPTAATAPAQSATSDGPRNTRPV